ncbi:transporter substrate-binding domain-containing protein [Aestuariibacter sp. AA17]|uniref:Transporter substrate-binding domain-containing protein n=1 Tax=Fluctibacter corallii TaxID=2984329 RepID=A0ABT3A8B4_9ALTE|nr:ABC transporter substrate-binding protein [Aestuariibacter sp. AA17]MCV2884899.1 transporter substrate-binding domain-containing protein [Aestuariibacter sp. AA17]
MSRLSFAIAILIFALFPTLGYASSQLKIFTEEFPPYNFTQNDELVGINTEIVKELCTVAGISCSIELLPWTRAYNLARQTKNTAVFSTSRNPEREKLFHWIGPLASSKTNFYRLKKRHDIKIRKESDLLSYTIGIARSDVYHDVLVDLGFKPEENLLMFSRKHDDMHVFFNGKLDLIIGSELTLPYQLTSVGFEPNEVIPVYTLKHAFIRGNYLALNRDTDSDIKSKLNTAFIKLKKRDFIEQVIDKYRDLAPR